MEVKEALKALRQLRVETGSLACLGCGHEHSCSTHGCAIIRAAIDTITMLNDFDQTQSAILLKKINALECGRKWIPCNQRLPEADQGVLIIVDGKPCASIELIGAYQLGNYSEESGWIVDEYPEWENPTVTHWMPLPEPPKED